MRGDQLVRAHSQPQLQEVLKGRNPRWQTAYFACGDLVMTFSAQYDASPEWGPGPVPCPVRCG
jgi:hypothetical protein